MVTYHLHKNRSARFWHLKIMCIYIHPFCERSTAFKAFPSDQHRVRLVGARSEWAGSWCLRGVGSWLFINKWMFRTLLHSGILKDIYGWFFLFPVLILRIFSISIFLDPHTVVKLGIVYWEDFFHHTVVAPPTRSEKLRPYIREMCPLWGGWGKR